MFKKWTNSPFFMNFYLILIFLLPNTIFAYLIMYIFLLLCVRFILSWKIILVFIIFLSFVLNVNSLYESKDFLVALNISFLILFFPFFRKNIKINIYSVYIIAGLILISQFTFVFHIPILESTFENIYKSNNSEDDFTRFIVGAERNGGLYFNPNQACKYLTSLLTLLLALKFKNRDKIIVSLILLTSILLTGSRTGFAIALAILLTYTIFTNKNKLITILLLFVGFISTLILGTNSRSFQFSETGSADYKLQAITDYWHKLSWSGDTLRLLLGNFTTNFSLIAQKFNLNNEFGFDAEIGIMLSSYGILFMIIYIAFYFNLLKWINKRNFIVIIPFLLWPLTSTILFSIKTSIVYFSILSIVISNTQNKNII